MAPYNPPRSSCHYSQIDVKDYDKNMILCMIGKGGSGFYKLTNYLNLNYVWYDSDREVIELWGSYEALLGGAQDKLKNRLETFKKTFVLQEV